MSIINVIYLLLRNTSGPSSWARKLQMEMQIELGWEPKTRDCELSTFGITKGMKMDVASQVNGQTFWIIKEMKGGDSQQAGWTQRGQEQGPRRKSETWGQTVRV